MVDNEMMKIKGVWLKCQIQYKGSITSYNTSKGS